jgi:hypothetical protein
MSREWWPRPERRLAPVAVCLARHRKTVGQDQVLSSRLPDYDKQPAECDLMAQLAGLELEDRFADWRRSPFTSDSESHISVWRKPTTGLRSD